MRVFNKFAEIMLRKTMISLYVLIMTCVLSACSSQSPTMVGSPSKEYKSDLEAAGVEYRIPAFPDSLTEPILVEPLTDLTRITVWQVEHQGTQIRISYTYTAADRSTSSRILLLDESGGYFLVYDSAGSLLTGYSTMLEKDDDFLFTYINYGAIIAVNSNLAMGAPVELTLTADPSREAVSFADPAQMARATDLLSSIDRGAVSADTLSQEDRALLSKAEEIRSWAPYLPIAAMSNEEVQGLNSISGNGDIIGSNSDSTGLNGWKDTMKTVCKVVKIAQMICKILRWDGVCQWVDVLAAICDECNLN